MEGKWKSGKGLTFGSNGMDNNLSSKFVYSGQTDPENSTVNWEETGLPGQRSMLANLNVNDLPSKGYIELDIAITGFEKSTGNPYTFLDQKVKEIKAHWTAKVTKSAKN
jgi:hypothetical protein